MLFLVPTPPEVPGRVRKAIEDREFLGLFRPGSGYNIFVLLICALSAAGPSNQKASPPVLSLGEVDLLNASRDMLSRCVR